MGRLLPLQQISLVWKFIWLYFVAFALGINTVLHGLALAEFQSPATTGYAEFHTRLITSTGETSLLFGILATVLPTLAVAYRWKEIVHWLVGISWLTIAAWLTVSLALSRLSVLDSFITQGSPVDVARLAVVLGTSLLLFITAADLFARRIWGNVLSFPSRAWKSIAETIWLRRLRRQEARLAQVITEADQAGERANYAAVLEQLRPDTTRTISLLGSWQPPTSLAYLLGKAHLHLGDVGAATNCLAVAVAGNPADPATAETYAYALVEKNCLKDAITVLRKHARTDSRPDGCALFLVTLLVDSPDARDRAEAEAICERLTAVTPKDWRAKYLLARILVNRRHGQRARVALNQLPSKLSDSDIPERPFSRISVCGLAPSFQTIPAEVSFLHARVMMLASDFSKAVQALTSLVSVCRKPALLHYWIGACYAQLKQYNQAAHSLETVLSAEPQNANALTQLGLVETVRGRSARAEQCLATALRIRPKHMPALLGMAQLRARRGDLAGALQILNQLVESQDSAGSEDRPYLVEAYLTMGRLCERQDNVEGTRVYYEQACRLDPGNPKAHSLLGIFLAARNIGEPAATLDHLNRVASEGPEVIYYRGVLLDRTGNYEGALAEWRKLEGEASFGPDGHGKLERMRGEALYRLGQYTEACEAWEQCPPAFLQEEKFAAKLAHVYFLSAWQEVQVKGGWKTALPRLHRAVELMPGDKDYLRFAVVGSMLDGARNEQVDTHVQRWVEKLTEIDPEDPMTLFLHTLVAARRGDQTTVSARLASWISCPGFTEFGDWLVESCKPKELQQILPCEVTNFQLALALQHAEKNDLDTAIRILEGLHQGHQSPPPTVKEALGALYCRRACTNRFTNTAEAVKDLESAEGLLLGLKREARQAGDSSKLSASELHRLGQTCYQQGSYAEATAHYEEALEQDPKNYLIYNDLGNALYSSGKFPSAIQAYQRAVQFSTDDIAIASKVILLGNLGGALREAGLLDRAIEVYTEASNLAPRDHQPHLNLAAVFAKRKDYAAAGENYRKAAELKPDDVEISRQWVLALYNGGMLEDALAATQTVINRHPNDFWFHNELGVIFFSLGQYEEAVASYTRALKLNPDDSVVCSNLGETLYSLRQFDEAYATFQRAVAIDARDVRAHKYLGHISYNRKDYGKAIEEYRSALRYSPQDPAPHCDLGNAYRESREYEQARSAYLRALELQPNYERARQALETL